jgi:5-methylcytosine-specific restriction endonuclease McrA
MGDKASRWRDWSHHFDDRLDAPPGGWRNFLGVHLSRADWFDRYNLYLRSSAWRQRRAGVIAREKVCQLCQGSERLEVHHITYNRVGAEEIDDLRLLCRRCHKDIESSGDKWLPLTPALREARDRKRHLVAKKSIAAKRTRRRPGMAPVQA